MLSLLVSLGPAINLLKSDSLGKPVHVDMMYMYVNITFMQAMHVQ